MKRYVIGVDLGGTAIKAGIFSVEGVLLQKTEQPTRTEGNGRYILPDIAELAAQLMAAAGATPKEVLGLGLGVPGAVLRRSFVRACVNLEDWGDFEVAPALQALCGLPVLVANDANLAAFGEQWKGSACGHENVVLVTIGTGVGGGVILGGKPLEGVHGCAGEIGHIKVFSGEKEACGCTKQGCLEQYASATGLVRLAQERLGSSSTPSLLRQASPINAKALFDAGKAGDPLALSLLEDFSDTFGRVLASISCVFDPEVFVIGGGVSKAGPYLAQLLQKGFLTYCFPGTEQTAFALASLGNDAGIYGAAKLILQHSRYPQAAVLS